MLVEGSLFGVSLITPSRYPAGINCDSKRTGENQPSPPIHCYARAEIFHSPDYGVAAGRGLTLFFQLKEQVVGADQHFVRQRIASDEDQYRRGVLLFFCQLQANAVHLRRISSVPPF